jgi:Clp amino terminal domain, pathogenicity island component
MTDQAGEPQQGEDPGVAWPRPTPRYPALLAAAAELAHGMSHGYVGAEHLFLAIIRDPAAVPTQVLAGIADPADVEASRRAVMASAAYSTPSRTLSGPGGDQSSG